MDNKIILSNRGKLSAGRAIRGIVGALIPLAAGLFLISMYDSNDHSDESSIMFVIAIITFAIGAFVLIQSIMEQKSFLELTTTGVRGASINPLGKNMSGLTPPKTFDLSYAEIQRADIEGGFVLLVTSAATYRCRAMPMAQQFADEIKRQKMSRQ